jgi:hypothetical protein
MTTELKISSLEKGIAEEKDPIKKTDLLNQFSFEIRHRNREKHFNATTHPPVPA